MKKYEYFPAMIADVKNWIRESNISLSDFSDREELEQYLNDEMFTADSVTGNGSGSYTFNTWAAAECICHNWDLIQEAADEFGETLGEIMDKGEEAADVTIRCYLLPQVIGTVLDSMDLKFKDPE